MRVFEILFPLVLLASFSLAICTQVYVDSGEPAELKAWVWKEGKLVAEADNTLLDFQLRIYRPDLSNIYVVDDGFEYSAVRDLETFHFDSPGVWRIAVVSQSYYGTVELCSDSVSQFERIRGGEKPKGFLEKILDLIRSIFGF